jgi:hypothetical protein
VGAVASEEAVVASEGAEAAVVSGVEGAADEAVVAEGLVAAAAVAMTRALRSSSKSSVTTPMSAKTSWW